MAYQAVAIVREFFRRMNTNEFTYASELFSDDFVLEWPQSQARIRGRKNFAEVNQEYPTEGRWVFTVNRIVGNEDEAVSDTSVTDGKVQARAITFSSIKDGKIFHQVEYWPEPYPPQENRKHLVEMME